MPANRIPEYWSAPANNAARNRWKEDALEDSYQHNLFDQIEKYISDHPGATVVTALTIGALLGWWGKRR